MAAAPGTSDQNAGTVGPNFTYFELFLPHGQGASYADSSHLRPDNKLRRVRPRLMYINNL